MTFPIRKGTIYYLSTMPAKCKKGDSWMRPDPDGLFSSSVYDGKEWLSIANQPKIIDSDKELLTGDNELHCPICGDELVFVDRTMSKWNENSTRWRCRYCEHSIPVIITITEIVDSSYIGD